MSNRPTRKIKLHIRGKLKPQKSSNKMLLPAMYDELERINKNHDDDNLLYKITLYPGAGGDLLEEDLSVSYRNIQIALTWDTFEEGYKKLKEFQKDVSTL